jgi:hypothetical protein
MERITKYSAVSSLKDLKRPIQSDKSKRFVERAVLGFAISAKRQTPTCATRLVKVHCRIAWNPWYVYQKDNHTFSSNSRIPDHQPMLIQAQRKEYWLPAGKLKPVL